MKSWTRCCYFGLSLPENHRLVIHGWMEVDGKTSMCLSFQYKWTSVEDISPAIQRDFFGSTASGGLVASETRTNENLHSHETNKKYN